jgi:hypothetical protein
VKRWAAFARRVARQALRLRSHDRGKRGRFTHGECIRSAVAGDFKEGRACEAIDDEQWRRTLQVSTSFPPTGIAGRFVHRSGFLAVVHPTRRAFPPVLCRAVASMRLSSRSQSRGGGRFALPSLDSVQAMVRNLNPTLRPDPGRLSKALLSF